MGRRSIPTGLPSVSELSGWLQAWKMCTHFIVLFVKIVLLTLSQPYPFDPTWLLLLSRTVPVGNWSVTNSIASLSSGEPVHSFVLAQPTALRAVRKIVMALPALRFVWAQQTANAFPFEWFRELLAHSHRFPTRVFIQALLDKVGGACMPSLCWPVFINKCFFVVCCFFVFCFCFCFCFVLLMPFSQPKLLHLRHFYIGCSILRLVLWTYVLIHVWLSHSFGALDCVAYRPNGSRPSSRCRSPWKTAAVLDD